MKKEDCFEGSIVRKRKMIMGLDTSEIKNELLLETGSSFVLTPYSSIIRKKFNSVIYNNLSSFDLPADNPSNQSGTLS